MDDGCEGEEERDLGEAAAIETLTKASMSRPEALKSADANATSAEGSDDAEKRRKAENFDVFAMERGHVGSPLSDEEVDWEEEKDGVSKLYVEEAAAAGERLAIGS